MRQLSTISMMLFLALIMVAGMSSKAFAIAMAGDTISNQATLNYKVSNVDQPEIDSDGDGDPGNGVDAPTEFTVDSKVDLSMTATSPTVSGANQVMTFVLTNDGNDSQAYEFELFIGTDGGDDDFDMDNVRVYIDNDRNEAFDGTETLISAATPGDGDSLGTFSTAIDAEDDGGAVTAWSDDQIRVFIVADVPSGQPDGETASYTIKAKTWQADASAETLDSSTGTSSVDVVLADVTAATGGVGTAADGARDGDYYATGTFTVSSAQMSITKSYAVLSDPINGSGPVPAPQPIPGAVIEYTITITNSGGSDATDVVMVDPVPANTNFVVGSLTEDSTIGTLDYSNDPPLTVSPTFGYSPAADAGLAGTYLAGTDPDANFLEVTVPTVTASGGTDDEVVITFQVIIE